jgi:tetratricopeptide (TPR) repeat protein
MHYVLEAKTLYLEGMRRDKRSRYNSAREIGLAKMMLSEGRHDEAYAAFKRILRKAPKDQDARKAIFKIAQWHYEHNDYPKALKIYEDAVFRWPEELNEKPEVNFYVGEIFFSQKKYKKARKFYYNLVNLDPDAENTHKSLNRIGDSYLLENNGRAALSVFNKSRRTRPGSAESQYGALRLADVGIQYPALPVQDMIFEVQPYFHPHEAYDKVFEEAQTQEILAEVTLSRGRAFLKEQRYLEALEQFKSLIPLEESSPIRQSAESLAKLAIIHLVDQYAGQKGYLPSLYAYGDFVSLGIGDVQNIKSLLQIGEAYKGIGMNAEALKFFERVKLGDTRGAYTDQLFLNLGEIHLEERKFEEAERVARIFLNKYPNSPQVPDAMKIHAGAYKGQGKFKDALTIYKQLLQRSDAPKAEVHYLIAETHFAAGDLRKSAQAYRQVLDNYDRSIRNPPDYVQSSYFKLGIVYHMQKRYTDSLDALQAGRTLYPKHSLRPWGDFLIVDNLERLNRKPQAETELKTLVQLKNNDELIQMAAESRLKVLDWEKRLKDQL